MHEYRCKVCKRVWQSSISQSRCLYFSCQSKQIVEKPYRYKFEDPTVVSEHSFEEAGQENDTMKDRQATDIRRRLAQDQEELLEHARKIQE